MSVALLTRIKALGARSPLLIGKVAKHNDDGTSTVLFDDGTSMRFRGTAVAVDHKVFVREGLIEGPAPDLPAVTLEV